MSFVLPLRLLNPFVVASASRAGVQVFSLLGMMLALAAVDLETFGAFSVAWVTTVIASRLLYSGFYQFLIRTKRLEDDQDTVFWLLFGQGAMLSLIMIGIGEAVGDASGGLLRAIFWLLAPIPLLNSIMAWWDARLVRDARVVAVGLALLGAEAFGFLVMSVALYQHYGQEALVAWRWAGTLMMLGGLAGLSRAVPRVRFSMPCARRALAAAWPLQGTALMHALSNYAADFLLAIYLSPAAAGAYRAASRIAIAGTEIFNQAMQPINWSVFGRHERLADAKGMTAAYLSHLRFLSVVAWPILVCLALFADRIILAFAKPELLVAGSVLALLAVAQMFNTLTLFLDPVLVCTNRGRLQFIVRLGFTFVLLAGVLLVARHGPIAVAAWQMIGNGLLAIAALWLIRSALELPGRQMLMALLHGLFMSVLCAGLAELAFRNLRLPDKLQVIAAALTALIALLAGLHLMTRHRILTLPRP